MGSSVTVQVVAVWTLAWNAPPLLSTPMSLMPNSSWPLWSACPSKVDPTRKGGPGEGPRMRPIRAAWWSGPGSTHTPGCLSVAPSGPTGGAVWTKLTWPVACTTNRCPWVTDSAVRVHAAVPGTSTTVGDDSAGVEADAEGEAPGGAADGGQRHGQRGND